MRRAHETMRRYLDGRELDIDRRLLYRRGDQLDPSDKSEWPQPQNSRESTLRKEVSQPKRAGRENSGTRFSKVPCKKLRRDARFPDPSGMTLTSMSCGVLATWSSSAVCGPFVPTKATKSSWTQFFTRRSFQPLVLN